MHRYNLVLVSGNSKTGPIPVSMTDKASCPNTCSLKGNGCYAQQGLVNIAWTNLSTPGSRARALTLEEFCGAIKSLRFKQLWRHNQAGDLPQEAR